MPAPTQMRYTSQTQHKTSARLQIEPNTTHRKEFAHMSLMAHLIGQPSLDNCPIWTAVITAEVKELHLHPL
jgi:hypothetical protein